MKQIVVLISGTGSNLKALIDATASPTYGVSIAAVISDKTSAQGLAYATNAGIETTVVAPSDYENKAEWDRALARAVRAYQPDLVVCAGFMRLLGEPFLREFVGKVVNTHPALLPAFPGAHAVRDALAHGVKLSGATVFFIDEGIDTGAIVAQVAVPVVAEDDENTLGERIKDAERRQLVDVVGRLAREGWQVSGRHVTIG
ncbi:MAG: phosphoribosylglycinamide formyltransferase [Actinomycetaceae bacterium]|nr:phosphoribosylglycinamide formyltransferase [Actinomycetaceae bacterium]